jgi:hypothetical protein
MVTDEQFATLMSAAEIASDEKLHRLGSVFTAAAGLSEPPTQAQLEHLCARVTVVAQDMINHKARKG